jgi:L-ribulose-5-phosphate 4-epimerase
MIKNKIKECIKYNQLLDTKLFGVGTFGNLSLKVDNDTILIKPSGIAYKDLKVNQFSEINIKKYDINKYKFKPSTDLDTHVYLYKQYPLLKCISHFHSKYATIWSQACKPIPVLGTTHSDYFKNEIPVTRQLTKKEIENNYQNNIAKSIVEILKKKKYSYLECPGALVAHHAAFVWGKSGEDVINKSLMFEFIAELAFKSLQMNKSIKVSKFLIEKHYYRKNGINSYYGQK